MTTEPVDEAKIEKALELWFTSEQKKREALAAIAAYNSAEDSLNLLEWKEMKERVMGGHLLRAAALELQAAWEESLSPAESRILRILNDLIRHLESQKSPETPGSESTSLASGGASPETTTASTLGTGITEPTSSLYQRGLESAAWYDPTSLPPPSKTTAPTSSSPSTEPSTGRSVDEAVMGRDDLMVQYVIRCLENCHKHTDSVSAHLNINAAIDWMHEHWPLPSSPASAGGESEEINVPLPRCRARNLDNQRCDLHYRHDGAHSAEGESWVAFEPEDYPLHAPSPSSSQEEETR